MIQRPAIFTLALLALLECGSAQAARPLLAEAETYIESAVFADGRLWVLSEIAVLSSLSESSNDRSWESFDDYVQELWVQGGQPAVITCRTQECPDWTIRRRTAAGWTVEAEIHRDNERLMAVSGATNTVLLTSRRIVTVDGGKTASVSLSAPLDSVAGMHVTSESLFVGLNRGEWGGGLRRIDRNTGDVTTIERNSSGQLCGGPLNSECDPVNGITVAPWNPQCLVLIVGLEHLGGSHGRIDEVCGTDVQRLYFKPLGKPRMLPGMDEPFDTVSFYQLVRGGNLLWANGNDGLYRVSQRNDVRPIPRPRLKNIGGVYVSFDLSGIVTLQPRINQPPRRTNGFQLLVPR
jgi:hypothetical protein